MRKYFGGLVVVLAIADAGARNGTGDALERSGSGQGLPQRNPQGILPDAVRDVPVPGARERPERQCDRPGHAGQGSLVHQDLRRRQPLGLGHGG